MPSDSEEYTDNDGNTVSADESNIIIMNICLLSGLDIDGEVTINCDHYEERGGPTDLVSLLRHLK